MCHGQGKDSSDKLAQELSRMHEYCKVAATLDDYKLLVRRFDGFQVILSERRGSCEILFALKEQKSVLRIPSQTPQARWIASAAPDDRRSTRSMPGRVPENGKQDAGVRGRDVLRSGHFVC